MKDVIEKSDKFDSKLSELATANDRNRRVVGWLVVSLSFDILLTVILGAVTLKTVNNTKTLAKQNHQSISLACESVNKSNGANLKLWNYLFTLPTVNQQPLTDGQKAAQTKQLEDFKVYINSVFGAQKC